MKILYFCPAWGNTLPLPAFLQRVKDAGYDGVETGLPEDEREQAVLLEAINRQGLLHIIQHWEASEPDFERHKENYLRHIRRMASCKPYLLNSHTGRDFFTFKQNTTLLQEAAPVAAAYKVVLAHETHRSRFSFAAHATQPYLHLEDIRFTLDISHWICVAETLLHDQQHVIDNIIPRVSLIHARIGHTQGPQVLEPSHSYWQETLERHLQIWDSVLHYNAMKGENEFAITTEFGPVPYMPVLPADSEAATNQWKNNTWMLQLLKERYKHYNTGI